MRCGALVLTSAHPIPAGKPSSHLGPHLHRRNEGNVKQPPRNLPSTLFMTQVSPATAVNLDLFQPPELQAPLTGREESSSWQAAPHPNKEAPGHPSNCSSPPCHCLASSRPLPFPCIMKSSSRPYLNITSSMKASWISPFSLSCLLHSTGLEGRGIPALSLVTGNSLYHKIFQRVLHNPKAPAPNRPSIITGCSFPDTVQAVWLLEVDYAPGSQNCTC